LVTGSARAAAIEIIAPGASDLRAATIPELQQNGFHYVA
jgi:hypothetical protein